MPTWFRRKGLKNAVTVSPFENTPFRRRPPAERLLLVLLAACVLGACAHQHVASTDPRSNTCDEKGITINSGTDVMTWWCVWPAHRAAKPGLFDARQARQHAHWAM